MRALALAVALFSSAALPPAKPKPIPWLADGVYVPEAAIYELQCATTERELCEVLGVGEWGGLLAVKAGVLRYAFDSECGCLLFLPDAVTAEAAEGGFAQRCTSDVAELQDGEHQVSRSWQRAIVWRDGESLVVRGPMESMGACEPPEAPENRIERFVPRARLEAAAKARAAEIGASVSACNAKTFPPRFGACRLHGEKRPAPAPPKPTQQQ